LGSFSEDDEGSSKNVRDAIKRINASTPRTIFPLFLLENISSSFFQENKCPDLFSFVRRGRIIKI
jgi:hypothetical protein